MTARRAVWHRAGPPGRSEGTALYLATFGYTRWIMFHLVSTTRLTAAGAVVLLIVPAAHLPATAALVLLAAVLIALNTVEYLRADSIGWRALLARRRASSGSSGSSGSGGSSGSSAPGGSGSEP